MESKPVELAIAKITIGPMVTQTIVQLIFPVVSRGGKHGKAGRWLRLLLSMPQLFHQITTNLM